MVKQNLKLYEKGGNLLVEVVCFLDVQYFLEVI